MGYTTGFTGNFKLNKPLEPKHAAYLEKFSRTRRIKRNASICDSFKDLIRRAVGLPVGPEGAYFVGAEGWAGQEIDGSIMDYNKPPSGQPGLWCHWIPGEDGTVIEWDGGEKFYNYVEWLKFIIKEFIKPWGYSLTGEVLWEGEDSGDLGKILVKDNIVTVKRAVITYKEEE